MTLKLTTTKAKVVRERVLPILHWLVDISSEIRVIREIK